MGSTTTDIASIVASVGGLAIAVVGILSEPLSVDSSRPILQSSSSNSKSTIVNARLWDDPFAPFDDQKPEPIRSFTQQSGNTLVLVVPVGTQSYEEDRENRLRMRYAVQRALLDAGFAPVQASILQGLTLRFTNEVDDSNSQTLQSVETPDPAQSETVLTAPKSVLYRSEKRQRNEVRDVVAPTQLFELRPMVEGLPNRTGIGQFSHVVVVWLPDSVLWKDIYRYNLFTVIDSALGRNIHMEEARPVYVLLGPWDSDQLARLQIACSKGRDRVIEKPPSSYQTWIVSYRATVAEALLNRLIPDWHSSGCSSDAQSPVASGQEGANVLYRLSAQDDQLCRALLKEAAIRSSGWLGKKQIRILVFSEWDTLYGRSLAETFRALANCYEKLTNLSDVSFQDLRHDLIQRNAELAKPYLQGERDPSFLITVVPYLRGLDGTSTLYSKAYPHLDETDSKDHRKDLALEPAEGTTQFDYLRRSTSSMLEQPVPFIPSAERPDAIVIFGSDVYDKLILLKFLKQTLPNCLYMTTDLDALYWHRDYLQYCKDLVVASAFPLEMASSRSTVAGSGDPSVTSPIRFRDTYQSAAYWSVIRILEAGDGPIKKWLSEDPEPVKMFRVGNSEPLQIGGDSHIQADDWRESKSILERNLNWINESLERVFTPIMQGLSPFWAVLIQSAMIGLASLALFKDIPDRSTFPFKARDRIWDVALNLLPSSECQSKAREFRTAIREKWQSTARIRDRKTDPEFYAQNPPRPSIAIAVTADREDKCVSIIGHFESRLATANTKASIIRLGLSFFSTIFDLYAATDKTEELFTRDGELRGTTRWNKEILPIVNYMERNQAPNDFSDSTEHSGRTVHPWIGKAWNLFSPLFPSKIFFFTSLLGLILIGIVAFQPDVYFVGPETRTPFWRAVRSLVEVLAILLSFGVFYRVCFEQSRFRRLINALSKLTQDSQTGLSNRRIVVILSEASEAITHLSFTPCALALLLFLSHLRPLGGVPIMVEIWTLLVLGLIVLACSFFSLRSAALSELENIRRSYEEDVVTSTRLITRLNSFATDDGPLQDTEVSLVSEIKELIEKNSDVPLPPWFPSAMTELNEKTFRDRVCAYLQSCRERNKEIISQLEAANQGVFTPLLGSPILIALLLPIGGAGGISLLTWLLTLSR